MAVGKDYLRWVQDQLAGAGGVSARRMFGAVGLYRGDVFFAIVSGDTLYFRVDDASRPDFERRGMQSFRPYPDRPQVSMSYYEVPADVLEDPAECVTWALRAVAAGSARPAAKRRVKRKRAV